MIKAVLFDIDNVLYNSSHQVEMARRAAVEATSWTNTSTP